jgi:hypothetical protein
MAHDPDKIQQPRASDAVAWDDLQRELARDVERVSDRLRGLSAARLAAAAPPYSSRTEAARATAQALADVAAGLEASREPVEPTWRTLPVLDDLSVGDQIAVTGHDLLAAARDAARGDVAWGRDGRCSAHDLVTDAAEALATLRRLL